MGNTASRSKSEWKEYRLEDFADINPTESIPKGTVAKKIPMEFIQPFIKRIPDYLQEEYKGGGVSNKFGTNFKRIY